MSAVICIAKVTFREAIRSKVLTLVLCFLVLLLIVSALFSTAMLGESSKVIADIALFGISVFSAGYCAIAGSSLLAKELGKKTIQNVLSKAVSRDEFLLGKFLGLAAVSLSLVLLMSTVSWIFLLLMSGRVNLIFWQAVPLLGAEALVVAAASIFFSSLVVTPLLSGIFTVAFFLAGRSSLQILALGKILGEESFGSQILRVLYAILPHLDDISIAQEVVYGEVSSWGSILLSTVYALGYALLMLGIAICFFRNKQFS